MFSVAALRFALRERELELPFTKDAEGRVLVLVVRAMDPERALQLRKRMPGTFYELVQSYKNDPGDRDVRSALDDAEEMLNSSRMLIEEGVVGFVDPDIGEMVPGRIRFTDEELKDDTMDGRILTAYERSLIALEVAKLSGEGEVAAAHGTFRVRDRRGMPGVPRDLEVHAGDAAAAPSSAAVANGGPDGPAVDLLPRG